MCRLTSWPPTAREIAQMPRENVQRILPRLSKTLWRERARGRANHWTYSILNHLRAAEAYRAALARLKEENPRK